MEEIIGKDYEVIEKLCRKILLGRPFSTLITNITEADDETKKEGR